MKARGDKVLLIIVLVIVLATSFWFRNILKNTFYFVFSPLQKIIKAVKEQTADFLGAAELERENQLLLEKHFALLEEISRLKTAEEENILLKQALNIKEEKKLDVLPSEIVFSALADDCFIIKGGAAQGIFEGNPVIAESSVLIGQVEEVFSDFSRFCLISQNDFVFDILIGGEEENILAAAKGKGGRRLALDLVLKEAAVKEADLVITASKGGNFPAGLLVGEVKEIIKTDAEPFQKGEILPYFVKLNLDTLFIITSFKPLEF